MRDLELAKVVVSSPQIPKFRNEHYFNYLKTQDEFFLPVCNKALSFLGTYAILATHPVSQENVSTLGYKIKNISINLTC